MIPSTPAGSSDPASSWSGHGGIVQVVDLHAAEHSWEVSPGAAVHGYGFNGQVPGPVIEATVGDRLLVQFSNGMDQPSALVWESPSVAATPMSTTPHPTGFYPGEAISPSTLSPSRAPSCTGRPRSRTRRAPWAGLYGVLLVRGPAEPVVDEERILVVHHAELNAAHRDETPHPAPVDRTARSAPAAHQRSAPCLDRHACRQPGALAHPERCRRRPAAVVTASTTSADSRTG